MISTIFYEFQILSLILLISDSLSACEGLERQVWQSVVGNPGRVYRDVGTYLNRWGCETECWVKVKSGVAYVGAWLSCVSQTI